MDNLGNILWWIAFFFIGIWLQRLLPCIDVLIAGLLLALEESRIWQRCWIALILVILQEGMGTLDFGATALWYPLTILFFFIGKWLFETRNFLFILLLSACLGATHFGIMFLIERLQYIPVNVQELLDESILQALVIPLVWQTAEIPRRVVRSVCQ